MHKAWGAGPRAAQRPVTAAPVIKHRLVPSVCAEAQDVGTSEVTAAVLEAVQSS